MDERTAVSDGGCVLHAGRVIRPRSHKGGVLPTVFVNTTQDRPAFESVHPSLGLIWDVVQGSSTLPRPRGAGGISQHTQGWSGAGRGSKRPWGIYVPPTGQKGTAICAWEMRQKPSSSV